MWWRQRLRFGGCSVPVVAVSGPAPPYTASAVHFDSHAWLINSGLSTTDNGLFSMTGWFKMPPGASQTDDTFGVVDPADSYQSSLNWHNSLQLYLYGPLGDVFQGAPSSPTDPDVWHSVVAAANTNFASGAKKLKMYIDDVDVSLTVGDTSAAFQALFNGLPYWFGNDASTNGTTMDCADVRIMPGVSLLEGSYDIPMATRRLFVDASNKPVDPATATAALGFPGAILFSGDATGFVTNQGTGGAFTMTGTLTNTSSSPSD